MQAKDPRFHALPHTSQRVGAFTEAVNELVYEVLMSKVRTKLTDVALLQVWNQEEEENLFELPSFSAYPLPYVMSIGEYLLTLPQQLLPVAGDGGPTDSVEEGSDEAQYSATEWMFKVLSLPFCISIFYIVLGMLYVDMNLIHCLPNVDAS